MTLRGGVGGRGISTAITRLRCLTDSKVQRVYVREPIENDMPRKRRNSKLATLALIDDNESVRSAPLHLQYGREPSPGTSRKPSPNPARGSSSRTISILDPLQRPYGPAWVRALEEEKQRLDTIPAIAPEEIRAVTPTSLPTPTTQPSTIELSKNTL
jgi:hypothetical protein